MIDFRPQTPGGFTIFCDDIREEKNGKRIYSGVYNSKLIIKDSAPAALPKLGFAVHYFERPGESDEPVSLRVRLPGDDPERPTLDVPLPVDQMRAGPLPTDPEADDPRHALILHFEITPCVLTQAGRIHVRALRGDLEVRLGSLLVEFSPPSETSETWQPGEQPQNDPPD